MPTPLNSRAPKRIQARVATQKQAMAAQVNHFGKNGKYVELGAPRTSGPSKQIGTGAKPKEGTADGTLHWLKPPGGGHPLRFKWISAEQAWACVDGRVGKRMAFTAAYLSHYGWLYVGPVLGGVVH